MTGKKYEPGKVGGFADWTHETKHHVTTEDLDRLETYLIKGRAAQILKDLTDWQPALCTWLKGRIEKADTANQVVNAQLIVLIALYEKQTNKELG